MTEKKLTIAAQVEDLIENEAVLLQKKFNRNFTAAKTAKYQFLFISQGGGFGEVNVKITDTATGQILKQYNLKGQKYVDSFLDLKEQSHYEISVEGISSEVSRMLVVEKL